MRWMIAAVVMVVMALANFASAAPEQANIAQQDWAMIQKLLPMVIVEDVFSISHNDLTASIYKETKDGLRAWLCRHQGEDFTKPQVVLLQESGYLKVVAFRFDPRKKQFVVPAGRIIVQANKGGEEAGAIFVRIDEKFPAFRMPLEITGWDSGGIELVAGLAENPNVRDRLFLD